MAAPQRERDTEMSKYQEFVVFTPTGFDEDGSPAPKFVHAPTAHEALMAALPGFDGTSHSHVATETSVAFFEGFTWVAAPTTEGFIAPLVLRVPSQWDA